MNSVFGKALADRRRSLVAWTAGLVLLTIWITSVFPVLSESDAFTGFIEDFPPELLALFGIDPATYLTGAGYLQAQMYSLFGPLMIIAFAVGGGVAATAGEEVAGTMDMLLSSPISRRRVLVQKVAAIVILTGAIGTAMAATLLVANPIFDLRLSVSSVLGANTSLVLLGLTFGGVALAVGAFTGRPTSARAAAFGLAFVSWLVTGFEPLYDWLELPSTVSPFTWFEAESVLLDPWGASQVSLLVVAGVLAWIADWLFRRRDIATEQSLVPERAAVVRSTRTIQPRSTYLLRNITGKVIWERRRSLWGWIGGLASLLLVTFAAWPALSRDQDALEGLISALPEEVFALFGLTDPTSLSTAAGFISSRTYQSIGPVLIIIFCVSAVSALLPKEEVSGVMDLVLANPRNRRSMLIETVIGVTALTAIVGTVLSIVALGANELWETELSLSHVLAANAGLVLLGICFGGIALALWSLTTVAGRAIRVTAALATVMYFLNGLGSLVGWMEPLRFLSPFFWYLGDTPPLGKGMQPAYLLLPLVAIGGLLIATKRFTVRDLGT